MMWRCRLPLVVFLLLPLSLWADDRAVFRAGAHAENVNPRKFPISVNGGMADRLAKGVHDPLHFRCLALDDGKMKIVIGILDACVLPRELVDEAKRLAEKATGIPASQMLFASTHTHTAPTLIGTFQSDPDPDYIKDLPARMARGVTQAVRNLEPARIGWASADNPRQVFNRRWIREQALIPRDPFGGSTDRVQMNPGYQSKGLLKPAGSIDPAVWVVSVQSTSGRPLALLANYSLHYVGGVEPLSADYFGAFADRIKHLLKAEESGPPFVGIMSNGTSGDINNINFGGPQPAKQRDYEQIRIVANDVAETALKAQQSIQHRDHISLAAAMREIELGVRMPSASDVERATAILEKARGRELRGMEEIYARETVLLAKFPSRVKLQLQALRLGDLGICAAPCEVFVEIGQALRAKSPFPSTFTIELANGYNGYLPTPEQHRLGGYETWRARSSYLEVDASTQIQRVLGELLRKVHDTR